MDSNFNANTTSFAEKSVYTGQQINNGSIASTAEHQVINTNPSGITNPITHTTHHSGVTTPSVFKGNYPYVTFRPLEGKFHHDKDPIGKMDPYCKFKIGLHKGKSSVAKSQGTHPVWGGDAITLKRKHNEEFAKIKIKDKDRLSLNDKIGEAKIRLDELAVKGRVNQWFTVEKLGKITGEVLLDIEYHNNGGAINTGVINTGAINNGTINTGSIYPEKIKCATVPLTTTTIASNTITNPITNPITHGTHHTVANTGILKGNYPTFSFRPIEGKFFHDKDPIGKMDPYCKFKIGWHSGKSSVAKSQGTNPIWAGDAVVLKRKHNEEFAKIKIKDKDRLTLNDRIGDVKIRLDEVAAKGKVSQWFTVSKLGKVTGEVLLDIEYHPSPMVSV